ncbi:MAG: Gfo/Idh/MocA family protein [Lachnospirales bacterium]
MIINKLKVVVLGCGKISNIYINNLKSKFNIIELTGCCDTNKIKQKETSEKFHIKEYTFKEILTDKNIDIVVNLTPPSIHYRTTKTLLENNKNVFTEKVLALKFEEGLELVELAQNKKLYLGSAPDTFLGGAIQTVKYLIDKGIIGTITSCVATLNRDVNYISEKYPFTMEQGGGIAYDYGIYYVTALLAILGKVEEVNGYIGITNPKRKHTFTSLENFEDEFELINENILIGNLKFQNNIHCSLHFNSNNIQPEVPNFAIYGTEGIVYLPDPNYFGGDVKVLLKGQKEPFIFPLKFSFFENERGMGVAEMAWAIRRKRENRASKELALHALEVIHGIGESTKNKKYYKMKTNFNIPKILTHCSFGKEYDSENEFSIVN